MWNEFDNWQVELIVAKSSEQINSLLDREYQHGFTTDIEVDTFDPGLDEDVIRRLSAIKGEPEFLLEWRLKAYRHWLTMSPPKWSSVHYPPVDYQAISYYSAPKLKKMLLKVWMRLILNY